MHQIDSDFKSQGVRCAGTLMLPAAAEPAPVIVMAHGFGGIRAAGLYVFAQRFVEAGYAVYLFDYRSFGDSDGTPRHWISPCRHLQDWSAAVAHVRTLAGIDHSRMVLWGTSFSGGHVIETAARDQGIHAVIAQVPHVSGIPVLRQTPALVLLRLSLAAMLDQCSRLLGMRHYSAIVGHPGEAAALTAPECWDGYARLLPQGARWENKVLSRIFMEIPFYNPIRAAGRVKAPTLIVAGRQDTVTPASSACAAAMRIPDCEFHLLDGNHFELHMGEEAAGARNIALQLAFLNKHCGRQ
jgi:pimeloyl-ACP methyl ester carboxylesterase